MDNTVSGAKKILIIEDELSIREVCRRVLANEGYVITTALNGKEGITLSSREKFNLFFVDIRTPEINGIEFYDWLIRKFPESKRRIIFTTGSTGEKDVMDRIKETGNPLLVKPFTPGELKDIVRKTIQEE